MPEIIDPIRETTDDARRQAKALIRTARYGALATLDPASGAPVATRVAVATASDGAPLVLVSALTPHTAAMLADPRVSLLVGEPGKGDPLAHPRVTVQCAARRLDRDTDEGRHAARRYLNRNPKAKLYADFADFSYFLLEPLSAALNGGFGKAFRLDAADIRTASAALAGIEAAEQSALDHMNKDHPQAIAAIAKAFGGAKGEGWSMSGLDPDGLDIIHGDDVARAFFPAPLQSDRDIRPALVALARAARAQLHRG